MEAGRQHLWDFDLSPENKLATIDAGPPVKKTNKPPRKGKNGNNSKKRGRAAQADDDHEEEAAAADDVEQLEVAEMTWWDYGLGPNLAKEDQPRKRSGKATTRNSGVSKLLSQQDESDDGGGAISSDEEQDFDDQAGDLYACPLMTVLTRRFLMPSLHNLVSCTCNVLLNH